MKRYIKRIISNLKYQYSFLLVLFSPFKGLKLNWYFGDITQGTPYFLPRRWVKVNKKDCKRMLQEDRNRAINNGWKFNSERTWEYYKNYRKPIPIKYFGWHFYTLGWKTKWEDYRFEYNPGLSIVLFGKQISITIVPNIENDRHDCYWEAWLWYNSTNHKLDKKSRLIKTFSQYSCTWTTYDGDKKFNTDYYHDILKPKYLRFYNLWKKIRRKPRQTNI